MKAGLKKGFDTIYYDEVVNLDGYQWFDLPSNFDITTQRAIIVSNALQIVTIEQEDVLKQKENILKLKVTPAQLRIALTLIGINEQSILDAISQLPEPNKTIASVKWEYAIDFSRENELLIGLSQMLGLTEEQLDNIFLTAINY